MRNGGLSWLQWLRWGPFLAQVVVTRRCNLSCGYCFEYDASSAPVPLASLKERLEALRRLRTWAVALVGGEPTLHPDLLELVGSMRRMGFKRRMMISNGMLFSRDLVDGLNERGLTDLNVSVDGVKPSDTTVKVVETLKRRLELLAERARFRVTLNAVIGSCPPEEVFQVVEFAESRGFSPRILLIHDEDGQIRLGPEQLAAYWELKRRLGRSASESHDYREKLIRDGEAPFRCRAGARYLYVDEFGMVRWCAQTRPAFGKELSGYSLDDLKEQFLRGKSCSRRCSIGCARTASAVDEWRLQRSPGC